MKLLNPLFEEQIDLQKFKAQLFLNLFLFSDSSDQNFLFYCNCIDIAH